MFGHCIAHGFALFLGISTCTPGRGCGRLRPANLRPRLTVAGSGWPGSGFGGPYVAVDDQGAVWPALVRLQLGTVAGDAAMRGYFSTSAGYGWPGSGFGGPYVAADGLGAVWPALARLQLGVVAGDAAMRDMTRLRLATAG